MTRDLMKVQLIGTQVKSPSAAINGASTVEIDGRFGSPPPADLTIRAKLWGLFSDGSERVIAAQDWPNQGPVTIHDDTAVRVWTEIDSSDLIAFGVTITTTP